MGYNNDQLIGCLPDLQDDIENLGSLQQFNQCLVNSNLNTQLSNGQFTVEQNNVYDQNSQFLNNKIFFNSYESTNFVENYQATCYNNQSFVLSSGNSNQSFTDIDYEQNHINKLEELMDTSDNDLISSNCANLISIKKQNNNNLNLNNDNINYFENKIKDNYTQPYENNLVLINQNSNNYSNQPINKQSEKNYNSIENCEQITKIFQPSASTSKDSIMNSNMNNFMSSGAENFCNQNNLVNQVNFIKNNITNNSLNNQMNVVNSNNYYNSNNLPNSLQSESTSTNNISVDKISQNFQTLKSQSNQWLDNITNQVILDMKRCGICVIDNFLGDSNCSTIFEEVCKLYGHGYFKDGLLVGNKINHNTNIRGDKIYWVEGKEPDCSNIGFLMRTLDQIIMKFSKARIESCSINNRTKAMIACYPGNGTKYVKHIDNPNQDGRYITCIYYLNKNWDSQRDGGTLRIFPKGVPYVANIDPVFDRVIFFWSDRRNPHEVMPAFSIRFAITLWYFNSEEREQYVKKNQNTN